MHFHGKQLPVHKFILLILLTLLSLVKYSCKMVQITSCEDDVTPGMLDTRSCLINMTDGFSFLKWKICGPWRTWCDLRSKNLKPISLAWSNDGSSSLPCCLGKQCLFLCPRAREKLLYVKDNEWFLSSCSFNDFCAAFLCIFDLSEYIHRCLITVDHLK